MQSITTDYTVTAQGQGRVNVHTWYGIRRINWDAALDSDGNHRAAVEKVIADINADRGTAFSIVASAPSPGKSAGWVFVIDNVPEYAPLFMSITVRFMPATNTRAAYMKAHSWLNEKGITVNYPHGMTEISAQAKYAADIMLDDINQRCAENGVRYKIVDYVQMYTGDRLFTLKML